MDASERLNRARMSLGKAVSAKERRDVSVEIISVAANLTAAKAKFTDIETTEHELRSVIGQGFLAEIKKINERACDVPRPNQPSRTRQIDALVRRTEEAYAMIDLKLDEEAANAIMANDPFIRAMADIDPEKDRAMLADLFRGIDVDSLCDGHSIPPSSDPLDDRDPVLEVGMTSMRPSEFPADVDSGIHDLFSIDPSRDPSCGTAECDLERSWFKSTG